MNAELQSLATKLELAHTPEAVFGEIGASGDEQAASLKKVYHRLAKLAHPDVYSHSEDQLLAQAAFHRLSEWFASAQAKVAAGIYGKSSCSVEDWRVVMQTKKRAYILDDRYEQGLVYTSYPGEYYDDIRRVAVSLKIPRDPGDNDLAENEARIIQALHNGRDANKFRPYLPRLLDSFLYVEDSLARQVNVFKRPAGWYSFSAVCRAYPGGIDPKDMAWIWRRLLVALGFAHRNGVIHGAVLPDNVYILPEQHGLMLAEWSFAVGDGEYIAVLDPAYAGWYPQEVQRKESPLPGTDIDMAARCMINLLGGDPVNTTLPGSVPQPIRSFFKGCTLASKRARPQDAWALIEEFDVLIQQMWGERKFHPFMMHAEPRR